MMSVPNVFISYSHDSAEHKSWVLKLATDLRAAGVDAILDQWALVPGQDLAAFMADGIAQADRVLMICSEPYVRKADGGLGGVGYERLIVTAEVTEAIDTKKFIPLIRENTSDSKIPRHLGPRLYIDFSNDENYSTALEQLCRELLGFPLTPKPPLGTNPFSGSIPPDNNPLKDVTPIGTLKNGQSILLGTWFEQEREIALSGLNQLKCPGDMELRFALHASIAKSQIDLLTAVRAAEITTFGWPIGVLLENSEEHRPRPFTDGIRAIVSIAASQMTGRKSYDYWSLTKGGDFYLMQNFFEDQRDENKTFFNTRIIRVTEALMFAEGLYKSLGVPSGTKLSVRITHEGLAGRILASATHRRLIIGSKQCYDNKSEIELVITLGTVHENLVEYVKLLLAPLFMLFDFSEFNDEVYDDIVRRFEKGEPT